MADSLQMLLLNTFFSAENWCISIEISLKFVPMHPIDSNSPFVHWCWSSDEPLPEWVLIHFTNPHMSECVDLSVPSVCKIMFSTSSLSHCQSSFDVDLKNDISPPLDNDFWQFKALQSTFHMSIYLSCKYIWSSSFIQIVLPFHEKVFNHCLWMALYSFTFLGPCAFKL